MLPEVERILVVGCSGGGKSTLAQNLSKKFNLEHIPLDRDVRFLPGWIARDKEDQRYILKNLVQRERWILDGTGPSSLDIRLPRTDLVLWVRVPRWVALSGLALRVCRHYGKTRPDMAQGCKEKLPDLEFLSYIWNFETKSADRLVQGIEQFGPNVPVLILKSRQEIGNLVEGTNPSEDSGLK